MIGEQDCASKVAIAAVFDAAGQKDSFSPGAGFRIVGSGFGNLPDIPSDVGVFLLPAEKGRLVRVMRYTSWTDSEITGIWPLGISGPQELLIETPNPVGMTCSARYPVLLRPGAV